MRCDVLVAGGGSAGLAAAVAAARSGAQTLLVERHGCLGGMVPSAFVHSICGLYRLADQPDPILINPGFPTEFARRLLASGGAYGPVRMGRVDVLLHDPAAFSALCDRLVGETPNLEVRFQTEVTGATGGTSIRSLDLSCGGLLQTVEPKAVVDATGDAVVTSLSGAGFEIENSARLQRPAFIFSLQGVDPGSVGEEVRMKLAHRWVAAIRAGQLPREALGAMLRLSGSVVFVTLDLDCSEGFDPTSPVCLEALRLEGYQLALLIAAFLKETVDGFSKSSISALPSQVGIRESRQMLGRYRMESDDLGIRFDDEVALAAWPMELRERANGARLRFPANGEPGGIPLRALRSKSMENLFGAGRCLSASHEAQASLRVIGTCLATGEAAGIAAALLATGRRCEAEAIRDLRKELTVNERESVKMEMGASPKVAGNGDARNGVPTGRDIIPDVPIFSDKF